MVKKTWTFKLGGKTHRVAIAHMPSSGKGGIWVDGVLQQNNVSFQAGSVHPVYIEHNYTIAVHIQNKGYDLTINGNSLEALKKRRAARTQEVKAQKVATASVTSTSLVRQVMAKRQTGELAMAKASTAASSRTQVADTPAWSLVDETPKTEAPKRDPYHFDDDPFADLDMGDGGYDEQPTEPAGLSSGNWFSDEPLFATDVFAEEKPKPAPVEEKINKPKKNKKNQPAPADGDSTPFWAWVFVGACILIPIVTLGGAIPGAIGFGGAAGVRKIARDRSMAVELRIGLVIGLVVACWAGLIVLLGGITTLFGA